MLEMHHDDQKLENLKKMVQMRVEKETNEHQQTLQTQQSMQNEPISQAANQRQPEEEKKSVEPVKQSFAQLPVSEAQLVK